MRYLYTTNPDEGCHEVAEGIYGRPVQTSEEPKLRKAGWTLTIDALRGTDHVREEKEGRKEEVKVSALDKAIEGGGYAPESYRANLAEQYEAKFGKKPHHKMKAETIRQKLEESDD